MKRFVLLLAVVFMVTAEEGRSATTTPPGTAPKMQVTPAAVAKRLESVATLLSQSSGAKQVAEKGTTEAKSLLDEAKNLHGQAEAAHRNGDLEKANDLLNQSTNAMFQAVRQSDAGGVKSEKAEVDFKRRADSVKALQDAHARICREKNQDSMRRDIDQKVEALLANAEDLTKKGQDKEGREELDKAYLTLKVSIERLRRGDTLVRSLNFASKAEEYEYEIDRNNTHEMLVTMLLKEKGDTPMVRNFVAKAKELRHEAERQASNGDHGKAISTLELSTGELIKAIRSSGIYIPG